MKNQLICILLFIGITLSSCNKLDLSNKEAEDLVKSVLDLPKTYQYSIETYNRMKESTWSSLGKLNALQNDGLISIYEEEVGWSTNTYINVTNEGKPFFIGNNGNVYTFKNHDIDFHQITGIYVNKEDKTATIRFQIMATNVSPVAIALSNAKYLKYPILDPIDCELIFKKFDNGWQLESSHNISSDDMINNFLSDYE